MGRMEQHECCLDPIILPPGDSSTVVLSLIANPGNTNGILEFLAMRIRRTVAVTILSYGEHYSSRAVGAR